MEIKELVPKLVEHYQRCINEMPEVGWYRYLLYNNVQLGIYRCAKARFGVDIYESGFIKEFTNGLQYVCDTPLDAKDYAEAKQNLITRVNRLKEFLTN